MRRPGHRGGWITEALAPVRRELDGETYERLSTSLTLLLGIVTLEWTARTLVESALAQSAARPRRPGRAKA